MKDDDCSWSESALSDLMAGIGKTARKASRELAQISADQKKLAIESMASFVDQYSEDILAANREDMARAREAGLSKAGLDRLLITPERIESIKNSLCSIASLDDPVGRLTNVSECPNGLRIERVSVPLGVIGVIYESRPNVTVEVGALCLKAGNATILRCGSDALATSKALLTCLIKGLDAAELPRGVIQLVPTSDRRAVGEMLRGLGGNLDVIVPRGGKSLVERVQKEARVAVLAHLEGRCHLYIDRSACPEMAVSIALNSKMRRTGVCGATEVLLVDRAVLQSHLLPVLEALHEVGCVINGDETVCHMFPQAQIACEQDWGTEFLDAIIAVRVVDNIDEAILHIEQWSSHHTDAIIAEDEATVDRFFAAIDSAIVMHNASTQFADGGEFGFGGEVGIATGRMHARGPIGCEQLTTFKYLLRGSGHTRP